MSTLKTNNVQVGQSVTATNNFTLYQPSTPDGTVRIGVGNSGATTSDVVVIGSAGITKGSIASGTAVTASGTSVDFIGIPSTAKRITVNFHGFSTSSTSPPQIQIGTSGGIQSSGYLMTSVVLNTGTPTAGNVTSGFAIAPNTANWAAAVLVGGSAVFTLLDSPTGIWVCNGFLFRSDAATSWAFGGSKVLSGTLDRLRITTVNGTDTFDAGTINILWEG